MKLKVHEIEIEASADEVKASQDLGSAFTNLLRNSFSGFGNTVDFTELNDECTEDDKE